MEKTKEHATRRLWKPKAEQTFQTVLSEELQFPALIAGESPAVGDEVWLDGKNATGTYLMPGGETIIADDGIILEIIEASEEVLAKLKRITNKTKNKKSRFKFKSTLK